MLGRWLRADLPVGGIRRGARGRLLPGESQAYQARRPRRGRGESRDRAPPGAEPRPQRLPIPGRQQAPAHGTDTVEFGVHPRFTASRIGGSGATVSVPATSLEAIADEAGFDQISLICDVEGAEVVLVERELDTLRRRVRLLLVEIHPQIIGEEAAAGIVRALEASGFLLRTITASIGSSPATSRPMPRTNIVVLSYVDKSESLVSRESASYHWPAWRGRRGHRASSPRGMDAGASDQPACFNADGP